MKNFNTEDILKCLDEAAACFNFPGFDNIHYDMITARLTGFRNDEDWALAIEQVVSWYSLNGVEPVLMISAFGSRILINEPFATYFPVKHTLGELERSKEEDYQDISVAGIICDEGFDVWEDDDEIPESISVMIRDEKFIINLSEIERNPHLSDYIDFDLMIHLVNKYRTKILATETEFREIVSQELSQIIQLDNWHHPDIHNPNSEFSMPSRTKSMEMIAEVLVSGNPELYQPCEENNVDWKKWIIK
ncbi:hypothetical protein NIES267_69900 [Calothrix parasitica NIES-267]|uniref:Uncharacterized protein n=1 Tax=Calothrix parasitica NIES-267 TaxID=1973488 RepID=A0A1Z4M282_9CYAN|nr:hypothetical protein NIES267_69900 [Calothrix parasitica NIES-267]